MITIFSRRSKNGKISLKAKLDDMPAGSYVLTPTASDPSKYSDNLKSPISGQGIRRALIARAQEELRKEAIRRGNAITHEAMIRDIEIAGKLGWQFREHGYAHRAVGDITFYTKKFEPGV